MILEFFCLKYCDDLDKQQKMIRFEIVKKKKKYLSRVDKIFVMIMFVLNVVCRNLLIYICGILDNGIRGIFLFIKFIIWDVKIFIFEFEE